jgi:hypothetical protein
MIAHPHLTTGFADIMYKSSIPYTEKGVPTHLKTNEKGDFLCNLYATYQMAPKRLYWTTQSYTLDLERRANGIAKALANSVRTKWNRHGPSYAVLGFAFSACAATTYGRLDSHLLCLLYIAAKK